MFRRIEIARYKCVRRADVAPAAFNILIGPNASGKSTFLDSLAFIRDAVETDVEKAVRKRANSLRELVWNNQDDGKGFEIAVEAQLPDHVKTNGYDRIRYEVGVGLDAKGVITVSGENVWLLSSRSEKPNGLDQATPIFPTEPVDTGSVVRPARSRTPPGQRLVARKVAESGNDYFRSEKTDWNIMLRFSPQRLGLAESRRTKTVSR